MKRHTADSFWLSVACGSAADCWPWKRGRDPLGYGRLTFQGKGRSAHRVAWELANGPIPAGLSVLHRCDNPPCVNPAHLFLGANADNVADKVSKGRQSHGPAHGMKVRGERHGQAKLTAESVREVRRLHVEGLRRGEIAALFNIHPGYVSLVTSGRRWGWLQ